MVSLVLLLFGQFVFIKPFGQGVFHMMNIEKSGIGLRKIAFKPDNTTNGYKSSGYQKHMRIPIGFAFIIQCISHTSLGKGHGRRAGKGRDENRPGLCGLQDDGVRMC